MLADKARGVMRRKTARLEEALDCSFFTPEHAFILQMMLDSIDQLTAQIAVLDEKITDMCKPYEQQIAQLDGIPGFGITTAQDLIAEIGMDMSVFPTAGHLASWARQTPRVTESAGKRKGKNATGRGNPYIGGTLGEASISVGPDPDIPRREATGACAAQHAEEEGPDRHHADPARHRPRPAVRPRGQSTRTSAPTTTNARADTRRRARSHVRDLERLGYKVTIQAADPETGELPPHRQPASRTPAPRPAPRTRKPTAPPSAATRLPS